MERSLPPRNKFSFLSNFLAVSRKANKKICVPKKMIFHFLRGIDLVDAQCRLAGDLRFLSLAYDTCVRETLQYAKGGSNHEKRFD